MLKLRKANVSEKHAVIAIDTQDTSINWRKEEESDCGGAEAHGWGDIILSRIFVRRKIWDKTWGANKNPKQFKHKTK